MLRPQHFGQSGILVKRRETCHQPVWLNPSNLQDTPCRCKKGLLLTKSRCRKRLRAPLLQTASERVTSAP